MGWVIGIVHVYDKETFFTMKGMKGKQKIFL